MMEYLETGEAPSAETLRMCIRKGVIKSAFSPVLCGSSYKNKGVQLLLDAVTTYLPNPADITNNAVDLDKDEAKVTLTSDADKPLVMLAFKLEDGRYGQLSYLRIYQGTLVKGREITNTRTGKRHKVGRVVRMHSDEMEEIETSASGDIIAMFGIDCNSGDTFTDGELNVAMTSMFVPDPVISLTVTPRTTRRRPT